MAKEEGFGINRIEDRDDPQEIISIVCFKIGEEDYAIDIMDVKEIIRCQKIIPLPKAPYFIEGVIDLRGIVVPIIDMRKRFGIQSPSTHKGMKILIVKVNDKIIGMLVDRVSNIIKVPSDSVLPPPEISKEIEPEYLKGVCETDEGIYLLLDLDRILTEDEKVILDKKASRGSKS